MQNQYFSLKGFAGSIFLRVCLAVPFIWTINGVQSAYATDFDLSDPAYATHLSAGRGSGQAGAPNLGNTNVSFSDFGVVPDSNPRSNDVNNPADLLPVNHQNTVTDSNGNQLQINSYASSQIKPNEWGSSAAGTGTSPTQAPMGQVSPYPSSRGSLPPVNMALQATMMPNAFLPIDSGKSPDFQHSSLGFNSGGYNLYQGPYGQSLPIANPLGPSALLGNSNSLPPTSLGSVDFNIRSK